MCRESWRRPVLSLTSSWILPGHCSLLRRVSLSVSKCVSHTPSPAGALSSVKFNSQLSRRGFQYSTMNKASKLLPTVNKSYENYFNFNIIYKTFTILILYSKKFCLKSSVIIKFP